MAIGTEPSPSCYCTPSTCTFWISS
jgi:hypothetical protein